MKNIKNYDHKKIEKKWQKEWDKNKIYKTSDISKKKKMYILDMFPYPSGEGLHVGHPRGYIATDLYSRMKRMQGFNVLHPMGWDAFGLPAENFAIKNKVHPSVAVSKNIKRFKEQLSVIGFNYDWSREINTTDPEYYKWTQWIFLQMYKKGLAYESYEPINWCPECKTGLANEDVEDDGTCERCGTKVEKKPMRQWVLKITDYADRMLADLDKLPKWPEGVKEAQRNWIGKSEGALIMFDDIEVFTTRVDTIFGATYIAIAGEKDRFTERYVTNPATKEKIPVWEAEYVMRDYGTGAVMGVPAHDERDFAFAKKYRLPMKYVVARKLIDSENLPVDSLEYVTRNSVHVIVYDLKKDKYLTLIWKNHDWHSVVLGGVEEGEDLVDVAKRELEEKTGYVDVEFKKILGGPIISVYHAPHKSLNRISVSKAVLFELNSEKRNPVSEKELAQHEPIWISSQEFFNKKMTNIELPFWRERIKGEAFSPFTEQGTLVDSNEFSGLSSEEAGKKIIEFVGGRIVTTYKLRDWVFSRQRYWGEPIPIIHCEKCGVVGVPEKDLPVILPKVKSYEPTGTGESPLADISKWVNVKCPKCKSDAKRETNTMPQWAGSSWYYLRFIDPKNKKVLVDRKKEKKFSPVDVYVGGDHATRHLIYARFWHKFLYDIKAVSYEEPFPRLEFLGFILAEDGRKMSKRWKNVLNPDEMVERFGADAFRLYEMFIGPFENTAPWSTNGLVGTYRFIEKVWKLGGLATKSDLAAKPPSLEIKKLLHKTIKKVEEDIEAFKFNTAVSSMMIFINEVGDTRLDKKDFKIFLQILAPFAPYITEELWSTFGDKKSIHLSSWPKFDPKLIVDDEVKIGVQVNSKVRGEIVVPVDANQDEVFEIAKKNADVLRYLISEPKRVIYIKGRLINIIV